MTMYGEPDSQRPDVEHARDVVALQPHRRAGLAREALDEPGLREPQREHELERDLLVELQVRRRDHDAHAAHAEDAVDPVLAGQHVPARDGNAAGRQAVGAVHAGPGVLGTSS